jgi:hypothetical protein
VLIPLPIIPPCFWPGPTTLPSVLLLALQAASSLPRSKPTLSCSPETSPSPPYQHLPHCLPLAGCSLSFRSTLSSHIHIPTTLQSIIVSIIATTSSSSSSSPSFTSTSTIPVSVRPHPVSPALNPASAPFETIAFVELANLPCLPQRRPLQRCPYCKQCVSTLIPVFLRPGDGDVRIGNALTLRKAPTLSEPTHNRPFLTRLVRIWMLRLSSPIFLCTSLINKR